MSGQDLIELWAARDARYRMRRGRMTPVEAVEIRDWRTREVHGLPPAERGKAWRVLMAWTPPEGLR